MTLGWVVCAALIGVAHPQDAARGELIAGLAGCSSCHTTEDGALYAGGYAVETAQGTFYGSNLTPDTDHGIGGWSIEQFDTALRRGRSPRGRPYYPAFPYTSYTRMTDADVVDLWAYLATVDPVAEPDVQHEPRGLARWRFLVRFWKALYFRRGSPDPVDDAVLARGTYLVEGPGHCAECHTPRNGLGALKRRRYMAGGEPPEPGPNLTPHPDGLGDWTAADLEALLAWGAKPDGDFVGGPMGELVRHGTSKLDTEDRAAIAAYVRALEPRASSK